ncbi:Ubiquitin carboxyl-terminal hydrolase [Mycena venus]|uniref:Ubiquitin carboxyl-terminal hydrolase n=1 Tax=Mycena venus TaxID=2733690 RepID=A0A8H7CN72_9AGAR|nr:Ubiquitin carboxyl-terminal hydrolase [Mycena venus]
MADTASQNQGDVQERIPVARREAEEKIRTMRASADTSPALESNGQFSGIPLESDPEIFTDFIRALGVQSLEFRDVLSINTEDLVPGADLALPTPIHAFVLVYTTTREYETGIRAARQKARDKGLGYAGRGEGEPVIWWEQTICHACGMFAMLHAVANLNPVGHNFIEKDSLLAALIRDALPLAPTERAAALKTSDGIAQVYNQAANRGTSELLHAEDEVPGHYVCFIRSPKDGHIYELDGGKNGPVDHDEFLGGDRDMLSGGLKLVRDFVGSKMDPAKPHFHLMALVPSDTAGA